MRLTSTGKRGRIFAYLVRLLTRGVVRNWSAACGGLLSLFFLPMMACPSWAAKRLTIAQLEQMLGTERAARKSDIEIARKISEIELSERLTDLALAQLNKQFASGSQPAMALLLLADRSAFLDPPANELPAAPTPDAATQQQLLEAAKRYAVQSLPNCPTCSLREPLSTSTTVHRK